jgi:hypothetical protein
VSLVSGATFCTWYVNHPPRRGQALYRPLKHPALPNILWSSPEGYFLSGLPERSSRPPKGEHKNEAGPSHARGRQCARDSPEPAPEKNPAAVELGRLGGLKGGKARVEKLSKNRHSEILKKAAET